MKKKANPRVIIPIIHCLASLLYTGAVFLMSSDRSVVLSQAFRNTIADETEHRIAFLISIALGAVAVVVIWRIIFDLIEGKISRQTGIVFGTLFVAGAIILCFVWPDSFLVSEDNLVTYSYAIRFLPEYWHSIYSGCVYAAMMFVFPNAISICVIQWMAFVIVIGYAYERIKRSPVLKGRGKWVVFLLFLVPDTYLLISNAYRTEQYCILCMYFITLVVMDIIDKRRRYGFELGSIMAMCALISVWRTEGIILGMLGFGALLLFVYHFPFKNLLKYCILTVMLFVLMLAPQKIGDSKYYGNDYTFINSFVPLQNILNCTEANLSYNGADEDLAAIARICPLNAIKIFNMEGYRCINYGEGRLDINQSGASLEDGAAYKKAYRRLVSHNFGIYFKTQVSMVLKAYGFKDAVYLEKDKTGATMDFEIYEYGAWDMGREDLYSSEFTTNWKNNSFRQKIANLYLGFYNSYLSILKKIKIYPIVFFIASVSLVGILAEELVAVIRKKKKSLAYASFAFILLVQYAAIAAVMPAGVTAYFHTCFYCTMILEAGFILELIYKPTEVEK